MTLFLSLVPEIYITRGRANVCSFTNTVWLYECLFFFFLSLLFIEIDRPKKHIAALPLFLWKR